MFPELERQLLTAGKVLPLETLAGALWIWLAVQPQDVLTLP